MQYTISIPQAGVVRHGLHEGKDGLDLVDCAILDYLGRWRDVVRKKTIISDGLQYTWVNYNHLMESMPLLGINNKEVLTKRFKKLRSKGLVETIQMKDNSLYFRLTKLYSDLHFTQDTPDDCEPGLSLDQDTGAIVGGKQTQHKSENKNQGQSLPSAEASPPPAGARHTSASGGSSRQRGAEASGVSASAGDVQRVLDALNGKAGRAFRADGPGARFISARLKEGYTVEQLLAVIELKVREWQGTPMEKYLRPSTLYNREKFEAYVNEISHGPSAEASPPQAGARHTSASGGSSRQRGAEASGVSASAGDVQRVLDALKMKALPAGVPDDFYDYRVYGAEGVRKFNQILREAQAHDHHAE